MENNKNNVVIFQSNVQNVKKEWIDYNGHMNVAYYTLAFDNSLDNFLETILEIGPTFVKKVKQGPYSLQANYHYCLLYTSPSPRDRTRSRMPSSA